MGFFSKLARFRHPGEGMNEYNLADYGQPDHSLFTSTKVFSLHHEIDVTDENENVVYHSRSKFFSLRDKTDVTDASGRQVAHIERKLFSLHERHFVTMASGQHFEISNELWHIIQDVTNIEGLGWVLRGNIMGLNFQLFDKDESIIATISQKMLSLHDKYCMDIYRPDQEEIVVAILITLQHMISDRNVSSSSSSSFSSSSGE